MVIEHKNLLNHLIQIDPSKKCLKFLAERIKSSNYRGMQLSQHNRYDLQFIATMLIVMNDLVGKNKMRIRTADLSKRPYNTPEEQVYAAYVDTLNDKLSRCTQDSVRKNLFVDINRMGLINRYDKNGHIILPYEKKGIYYVSLSDLGYQMVKEYDDIFKRNLIFTKALDKLTKGLASEILDVVSITGKLTIYEFMFFLSFMNMKLDSDEQHYTKGELTEFIIEYRSMSKWNRDAVVDTIQEYCNPKAFGGDKTNKRDFHNWKNEAQQIFSLLDQTVLYEYNNNCDALHIRIDSNSLFENDNKLKRSIKQKEEYFKHHNIRRKIGFELHHIIPLLSARDRDEFASLDVWENMIYIDGFTHSKISQTNNKNTKLAFDGTDVILKDNASLLEDIICHQGTNVEYDALNIDVMQNYNDKVIQLVR